MNKEIELRDMWRDYKKCFTYQKWLDMKNFWWEHWGSKNHLKTTYQEFIKDHERRYFIKQL